MSRTGWFSPHPPACTCASCTQKRYEGRRFQEVDARGRKIGRNEVCPCGSGKKYKRCHGA